MGYKFKTISVIAFAVALSALPVASAAAQSNGSGNGTGFSLQVTPSPIVETIKPGENKVIELRIHNNNTVTEHLKVTLNTFTIDQETGEVKLDSSAPADVKDWVIFAQPTFDIGQGAWFTEDVDINTPSTAGFSYSFAIEISRSAPVVPIPGSHTLQGSIAVFTLLSIDRPGSQRKFEIDNFTSSKHVYEYLPATFNLKLKNTGNTIVQPAGNVYIQRSPNSKTPLSVLPLNPNGGYILPGTFRALPITWKDGFPTFVDTKVADNVAPKQHLVWNWNDVQNFRIGHYTAKLVAVYNNGQSDVPVIATIGFWVIPWKLLIGVLFVVLLLGVGLWTIARRSIKLIHHKNRAKKKPAEE